MLLFFYFLLNICVYAMHRKLTVAFVNADKDDSDRYS